MKLEDTIIKYPRTPHIQGSRLQLGDEDLRQRPFSDIARRNVVLEEKIDGANSAVSFIDDGELRLQSRGHFLTGGYRERHYGSGELCIKTVCMKCWGFDMSCMVNGCMPSIASIMICYLITSWSSMC